MTTAPALVLRTDGPEDTRAVAAAVATLLEPGDAIALTGDLGAGKTCFVQGAAKALGVEERITSPTFVLLRSYDGDIPLVHCDVYRLERIGELRDLGEDLLSEDVVSFIEWGDAITAVLPEDHLEVALFLDDPGDPDSRTLKVVGHGRWSKLMEDLADLCRRWAATPEEAR